MFEHADRNDAVKAARDRAIVDQLKADAVGHPRLFRAATGDGKLFLAQGYAQHVDIGDAVQVKREAAPPAADIKHLLAGLQQQLGHDMGLLVGLRLFKAVVRIGEIRARSEERRGGKEWVSTGRSRWAPVT